MQPRPPDLALVEFGINANARDLPHFASLLRTLRDARVATVVVNVERYGSWRNCDSAHCRSAEWLRQDEARRDEAWPSQVRALEAIARDLTTPVVNLRRAVGSRLGTSPYTLARFMKDCRHPGPLGNAPGWEELPPPRRASRSISRPTCWAAAGGAPAAGRQQRGASRGGASSEAPAESPLPAWRPLAHCARSRLHHA